MTTNIALGIGIGSSTVSAALVSHDGLGGVQILERRAVAHDGDPLGVVQAWWQQWRQRFPSLSVAITGRAAVQRLPFTCIDEVQALEAALPHLGVITAGRTIVSAGGEMILAYRLDQQSHICQVTSGNKCASGTGAFFRQQVRRMGLDLPSAAAMAGQVEPIALSRRCSVFCKSDCTHALNKGRPKAEVVAGLCEVIAGKIRELAGEVHEGLVLIGGCARNSGVIGRLTATLKEPPVIPQWPDTVEALGAAVFALEREPAIALTEQLAVKPGPDVPRLPSLSEAAGLVHFCTETKAEPRPGASCLVGLDVGSTTTKAVLMDQESGAVWGRIYLRTEGDPVAAAQRCYRALAETAPAGTRVVALGTTGSGRVVAGLHAKAAVVINEILAHARAAARFDPEVDTIFEIGGQDAKYTHLIGGVPADAAMNEACSAGTGSFLEEAAREAFGLAAEDIAARALAAKRPARFSEQCAAFIGSDIATAIGQGVNDDDILAGLVYGVCRNYLNKVKGSRPVGRKVLIQGGVCYNRAVPLAMAALSGRPLVVPPDPGLMGAVGVAFEVRERLRLGVIQAENVDLTELAVRPFRTVGNSVCRGGKEGCDYRCPLLTVEVAGERLVVGGLCGRWERGSTRRDPAQAAALDGVAARSRIIFAAHQENPEQCDARPTMGLNRSFLTHTFHPYFQAFFQELGWRTVMPSVVRPQGVARQGASFCHPVAQAHGLFADLVARDPDRFFLPHLGELPYGSNTEARRTCVFVQGESYALRSAFPEVVPERILSPVLNLRGGMDDGLPELERLAPSLGASTDAIRRAHRRAVAAQAESRRALQDLGKELRAAIRDSTAGFGVVIFGRAYNALTDLGNLGIPRKLASWGVPVIPYDCLNTDTNDDPQMYWANGQALLRAARTVAGSENLYGLFITSFSCGPDSFLITRWRDALEGHPTLTVEIDGHTADAGVDTRLDAFLDVIRARRRAERRVVPVAAKAPPSSWGDKVRLANGTIVDPCAPGVRVWLPRMGDFASEALAAVMRSGGMAAQLLPQPDAETLQLGRAHALGKECLPFHLTFGAFLRFLQQKPQSPDGCDLFFMPTGDGPCRQGQYGVMVERHLRKANLADRTGVLSLSDTNAYAGLSLGTRTDAWRGLCTAELMEDVQLTLAALACDRDAAQTIFAREWHTLVSAMEKPGSSTLIRRLKSTARHLGAIALRQAPESAPTITLVGEIFVRKDVFSRADLMERLQARGFVVRVAPIREYLHYAAWMQCHHPVTPSGFTARLGVRLTRILQSHIENRVHDLIAASGLLPWPDLPIRRTIGLARPHIDPRLPGETVLTVGSALDALLRTSSGVVAIGPFGCMPNRLSEALLSQIAARHPEGPLPFLAVETDGGALPPLVQARLDAFLLQAERRHRRAIIPADDFVVPVS